MTRWPLVTAALAALLVACSSTSSGSGDGAAGSVPSHPSTASSHGSPIAEQGCGSTTVEQGDVPAWLVTAGGGTAAPTSLPYVVAHPPIAGGFFFASPLRSGHPTDPANKILWAMRVPRDGSPLIITAHPLGASGPAVSETLPDDSSPGEIYPDGLDVPRPGCWQLSLSWGVNHAQIELDYQR